MSGSARVPIVIAGGLLLQRPVAPPGGSGP